MLNSQFYEDSTCVKDAADKQDVWLEQQLQSDYLKRAKHVIIFQHIPWFLTDIDEKKEYSNLDPELRKSFLEKFNAAGTSDYFVSIFVVF